MSAHPTVIATPYAAQRLAEELQHRARDVYLVGFKAGEQVAGRAIEAAFDKGLGVGACIGMGVGAIVTLLFLGWVP